MIFFKKRPIQVTRSATVSKKAFPWLQRRQSTGEIFACMQIAWACLGLNGLVQAHVPFLIEHRLGHEREVGPATSLFADSSPVPRAFAIMDLIEKSLKPLLQHSYPSAEEHPMPGPVQSVLVEQVYTTGNYR